MSFEVQGKVCVVTGAASGIGRSFCMTLAEEGCKVVVASDIDEVQGEETVRLVKETFPNVQVEFIRCDVSVESDIRSLLLQAAIRHGGVDVFFGNAGVISVGGIETMTDEQLEFCNKINVMQNVWAARALIPNWLSAGKQGAIVITASAAGLLNQAGALAYAISKRSAVSLAEFLALTYGNKGVTVVCVCPQAVRTPMSAIGGEDGGVAGVDGILEPADVTRASVAALKEGRFMVAMPEPVTKYMQRKSGDYDRWIKGMQRLNDRFTLTPEGSKL